MAGLKQIKTKIRSVEKTQTVTKAMEAVSAAKMRKAQVAALSGRAYARAAVSILARVSGSAALKNHPLTRGSGEKTSSAAGHNGDAAEAFSPEPLNHALYIVITSDKGLAGGLNSAVLRRVQNDIQELGLSTAQVSIVAVGKKALDFFTTRGFSIEVFHPNTQEMTHDLMQEIVAETATRFTAGVVDTVKIVYQQFISTFEQRPTIRTIFPLSIEELSQVVKDIIPTKGAYSDIQNEEVRSILYTVEPSEEVVFNAILPKLASVFVSHALLESQASEHSARMVAMKSASDKAEEMEHTLKLQYNKARQAAITREVSEITGGMEAMAN